VAQKVINLCSVRPPIFFSKGKKMTISAVSGVAARCNLCFKNGPIIRYDVNRFRNMGAGHPNEAYINSIYAIAEKEGLAEGFLSFVDPVMEANFDPNAAGGVDANGNAVIDPYLPQNHKHLCSSCVEFYSNIVEERKKEKNEKIKKLIKKKFTKKK
jgi:hypothetical protein